jgi:type II secretory pathway component PulF
MPSFQYLAQTREGGRRKGRLEAASADGLEAELQARGLLLVTCEERKPRRGLLSTAIGPGHAVPTAVLGEFVSELGVAQAAGLPLLGTLDDIASAPEYPLALRDIAASLARSVRSGSTLADSMRAVPGAFPGYFIALIEVGERTGRLDQVCEELHGHLRWRDSFAKVLLGAAIYPSFVLAAMLGLFVLLVTFVLPRLAPFLRSLEVELPLPTRVLISLATFFTVPVLASAALLLGVLLALLVWAWRSPRSRARIDRALLALPIVGPLIVQLNACRLAHSLGLMLGTGIDLVASLQLCEGLMGNRSLADLIVEARGAVLRGETLSSALARADQLPRLLLRAIAVGENTGHEPELLREVASYYDRELPGRIKRLFASFYPIMVIVLGSMILFTALGVLMPIYSSVASVGR